MSAAADDTAVFIPATEMDTPSRHICCRCKHQRGVHIIRPLNHQTKQQLQTTATRKDEEIIQSINDGSDTTRMAKT
ncbi:hypothetical protein BLA29_014103 [Euroglyphus maynei]|uniref:Uncharacterized protein n=1 Tax=Euroglyphus maynei TaxID=6958 RepID=A0A1Y3B349_EURMA|nr:hypothetical protein BLA29_014103 [Euroglyphus maynei]